MALLALYLQPINHAGVANEFIYLRWMRDRNEQVWNLLFGRQVFADGAPGHFREPERDFFFSSPCFEVVASVISASALKRASHPVARFGVAPPKLC